MALAPRASPPESRPLRLLLLLSLVMAVGCAGCKLDQCSHKYQEEMEYPDAVQCELLSRYSACLRATARSCRGDLKFHTTTTILARQMNEYNCSMVTTSARPPPPPPPPPQICTYKGRRVFRHCGLFGDPHLKTFYGEYQTCRVRGAWPLIDNPYLAVQVTNEPVLPMSQATATTKVTIVIRSGKSACAREKTYQATSENPLPSTFIDGTQRSGPEESVVLTAHDGQHVEIYVRYIESTLIVRQTGKYLAFSAHMPEDLLGDPGEDLQLCMRGCPPAELLDPVKARGDAMPWTDALERCRRTDTMSNNVNLTDHYLDWCVFDVMTTGDGEAADFFTAAAYHAQADVIRLDPASLKNRTVPTSPEPSQGVSIHTARTVVIAMLLLVLRVCL
ncbi:repulsive guidance molecule B [Anabrus simplex]|uniref:repulsive guidance molecule B n=1 Tax=Anabrus simplex TaxID=316456 RepID=UPI0034DD73CF